MMYSWSDRKQGGLQQHLGSDKQVPFSSDPSRGGDSRTSFGKVTNATQVAMRTANNVRIPTHIVGFLVHVFKHSKVLLPSQLNNDKNRPANPTCSDDIMVSANARLQGRGSGPVFASWPAQVPTTSVVAESGAITPTM